jgi:glycosyltransferase involved in cell wall biosynthesis
MAVLAHGRPLVTTAPVATTPAAPAPELRHGENVWLVPADDPTALAEAIGSLAADPARRAQLGHGARALAGLFDWGRIAGLTADFYAEVVAGQALTPRR